MILKFVVLLTLVLGLFFISFWLKNKKILTQNTKKAFPALIYDIKINTLTGKPFDLSQFKNKPLLIVNVASECGFTKQYNELETLYQTYKSQGLIVIGVPSNDFGGQEPGTAEDIQSFCQLNFGVTFPLTEKVKINGENQHELYNFLTQSNSNYAGKIKWNFTKFIVDKNGVVVDRFSPITEPMSKKIVARINQLLH